MGKLKDSLPKLMINNVGHCELKDEDIKDLLGHKW